MPRHAPAPHPPAGSDAWPPPVHEAAGLPDAAVSVPGPPDPARRPPGAAPRLPHQAVPGITELWRHTLGDPSVIVGIYESPPDLSHPCLADADLEARTPWWSPAGPVDDRLREHGTFTASVVFGRPGTVLPGLAPHCRGVIIGDTRPEHPDLPPDPWHTARAVEELLDAGAHIIQFNISHHTASADTDEMLKRAIARAVDAGVLVTAAAGNDYGACVVAPALLPGVLVVGAHRADGAISSYSNYGPAYAGHGITALGEAVLGATPGDGGVKARKGTCTAVALVTGAAALLVSMQRHLGRRADPLAVRDALLATARPCTAEQAHGNPARCLNGYLDLPAATAHLFPDLTTPPPPEAVLPTPAAAFPSPPRPGTSEHGRHPATPATAFVVRPLRRPERSPDQIEATEKADGPYQGPQEASRAADLRARTFVTRPHRPLAAPAGSLAADPFAGGS